jgi:hypothetical protein
MGIILYYRREQADQNVQTFEELFAMLGTNSPSDRDVK